MSSSLFLAIAISCFGVSCVFFLNIWKTRIDTPEANKAKKSAILSRGTTSTAYISFRTLE
jgi:hypothetical protein